MERTRESLDVSIVIPCSDDPLVERCLQSIDAYSDTVDDRYPINYDKIL